MPDTIRRQCPKCSRFFYLDKGTALCPHCGKCVCAADKQHPSQLQDVLGQLHEFWQQEITGMLAEFAGTQWEMSVRKLAERMKIELEREER